MSCRRFRVNTLHSCLNVMEFSAWKKTDIWSLSRCTGNRTQNHFLRNRTLNHLAKLTKWLSCVVCTYLFMINMQHIWSLSGCNRTWTSLHLVREWTLSNLVKLTKAELYCEYLCVYDFMNSGPRFRVNPHSIVAWMSSNSLVKIGAISDLLSDCNGTRTQNHLVRKQTLNHLAKLIK